MKNLVSKAKIGISLYSYGADIFSRRMTVREAIEHAASLDVEGIEIVSKQHIPNYPYPSVYDLEDLRDYIESFGMLVSCYSTHVEEEIRHDRDATWDELIKMVKDHIAEAHIMGAKVVRPYIAQTETAASVNAWAEKIIKVANRILEHRMAHALGVESKETGFVIQMGSSERQDELIEYVKPMIKDYQQATSVNAQTSSDVVKLLTKGKVTAKEAIELLKLISVRLEVENKEQEKEIKAKLMKNLEKE